MLHVLLRILNGETKESTLIFYLFVEQKNHVFDNFSFFLCFLFTPLSLGYLINKLRHDNIRSDLLIPRQERSNKPLNPFFLRASPRQPKKNCIYNFFYLCYIPRYLM